MNSREEFIGEFTRASNEDLVEQLIVSAKASARDSDTGGWSSSAKKEVNILKAEILRRFDSMADELFRRL